MKITNIPGRIARAFASSGNKADIPIEGADADRASYSAGFPMLNMTPISAGGVAPYGADFNGILHDLSHAIMWQQALGIRPFDAVLSNGDGYPAGSFVTHSGALWKSTVDDNKVAPPGAGWERQSLEGGTAGQVLTKQSSENGDFQWKTPEVMGGATEQAEGIAAIASTAEAIAMLIDHKMITPKKLGSVINSLSRWMPVYKAGTALPINNIGPIWHEDYSSVMTWQAFTANGASYTGYASQLVGSILADTQRTPRPGYIRSGQDSLSRTQYAALRAWAMHNGIMVSASTWAAGAIAIKDNADGLTFTLFDVRGEFPRFWDDGRGVDLGRQMGSSQSSYMPPIPHTDWGTKGGAPGSITKGNLLVGSGGWEVNETLESIRSAGGDKELSGDIYPRNVALLACVKF